MTNLVEAIVEADDAILGHGVPNERHQPRRRHGQRTVVRAPCQVLRQLPRDVCKVPAQVSAAEDDPWKSIGASCIQQQCSHPCPTSDSLPSVSRRMIICAGVPLPSAPQLCVFCLQASYTVQRSFSTTYLKTCATVQVFAQVLHMCTAYCQINVTSLPCSAAACNV
jgi:hypothetical protein